MQRQIRHWPSAVSHFAGCRRTPRRPNVLQLNMAEVQHETVFFSGRVQGVGFRYTTRQVAKEFEVTGFVKNLADGRVQLEAEGAPAEVAAFITAVEERMHGLIRQVERHPARRAPQFRDFDIR